MAKLDFTLSSIKKRVMLDIPNKFYSAEEVSDYLREILIGIDHCIFDKENKKCI